MQGGSHPITSHGVQNRDGQETLAKGQRTPVKKPDLHPLYAKIFLPLFSFSISLVYTKLILEISPRFCSKIYEISLSP